MVTPTQTAVFLQRPLCKQINKGAAYRIGPFLLNEVGGLLEGQAHLGSLCGQLRFIGCAQERGHYLVQSGLERDGEKERILGEETKLQQRFLCTACILYYYSKVSTLCMHIKSCI